MNATPSSGSSTQLRDEAELKLTKAPLGGTPARSATELVHELQVHQIELEMQNESLRQAQLALEESRDRYLDLFEFAPVGYLTLSREGQIASINLTGTTMLGSERSKLLGRRFTHFLAAEDHVLWESFFISAWRQDNNQSAELTLQRADGSLIPCCLASLRVWTGDPVPTLNITLTDIAERQLAVRQLLSAHRRLENIAAEQATHLTELAGELTRAEQRERDLLYEQLHDDMQPLLVAARLSLSSLSSDTPQAACLETAAEACRHISQVIQVARGLSHQLSPPLIRERGLNPALESLCRWVRTNHGLEVDLRAGPDTEPDDVAVRLVCFNAVRELLVNVAKHAGTVKVCLSLGRGDHDSLRIRVTDQGKGFDLATITNGSGLAAIARRLEMFGGSLQVNSQPGQGTVVTLFAPLQPLAGAEWTSGNRDRRKKENDAQDTDRR